MLNKTISAFFLNDKIQALLCYSLLIFLLSQLSFPVQSAVDNIIDTPFPEPTQSMLNTDQHFLSTQLIISLKQESSLTTDGARQQLHSLFKHFNFQTGEQLTLIRELALAGRFVVKFKDGKSPVQIAAIIKLLQSFSLVESAEEDSIIRHTFTPNDTFYAQQWPLFETTGGIAADVAWQHSTGQNAIVAVLDTGYTDHPDLVGSLIAGHDFISDVTMANDGNGRDSDAHDPGDWMDSWDCGFFNPPNFVSSSWHGTHTMGTVAAVSNNNLGVAGLAFNSNIVPVRVLGKCGGRTSDIADAIVWASGGSISGVSNIAKPANVISMSLGGNGPCSSTFQAAINQAINNGSTVIVAAGNDQQNFANHQPSNCAGVISVAATDRQGNRAYYSNYGDLTVSAPGGEVNVLASDGVLSTYNTGSTTEQNSAYAYAQGTSMATPHVAGIAAMLYQKDPNLTPDAVKDILITTARLAPGNCSGCGAGIVDAGAAVMSLNSGPELNQPPVADFTYITDGLNVAFTQTSTDSDGSIISWVWDFGDENGANAANPHHSYLVAGNYQVSLKVTDDSGATDTITQTVTVLNFTNQPPVAEFSFSTNELNVIFIENSTDDGTIVFWHWDFGDENESAEKNPQYTYGANGDYQVSLTVTDDLGATDTVTKTVSVVSAALNPIELSHSWKKLYTSSRLRVRLQWSGATSAQVDIYFNGQKVMTTRNDGRQTHRVSNIEPGTVTYQLCEADSNNCSNLHLIDL